MNQEHIMILRILVKHPTFLTLTAISSEAGYSKRKIQQLLDELNKIFQEENLPKISRIPGKGIFIDPQSKKVLQERIEKADFTHSERTFFDRKQRQLYMIYSLITHHQKITTAYWERVLKVSNRTVKKDMKSLKSYLQEKRIEIIFDKKNGYCFKKGFSAIKSWLIYEMNKLMENNSITDPAHFIQTIHQQLAIKSCLDNESLQDIQQFIFQILPVNYTRHTIHQLILYTLFSLEQRSEFNGTQERIEIIQSKTDSVSLDLATVIVDYCFKKSGKLIRDYDLVELAKILAAASNNHAFDFKINYPVELEVLTHKLIKSVSKKEKIRFDKDGDLYHIIVNHMISLVNRMKYYTQVQNPLLNLVERKYTQLHDHVKDSLSILEDYIQQDLLVDEASYFTLYFASSIEKIKYHQLQNKKIVIVCNSGNAISRLLEFTIKNQFNVKICAVLSKKELGNFLSENSIDMIISAEKMEAAAINGVELLQVSPLLTDSDIASLESHFEKKTGKEILVSNPQEREPVLGFLDLLPQKAFSVVKGFSTLSDLITYAGELLINSGCIHSKYLDSMLDLTTKASIASLEIIPGIIFPHAGISENVYQPGLSFVRLEEPLLIGEKQIYCAIAFCTTDKTIHKDAVRELGILLNEKEFVKSIKTIGSYNELTTLIKHILQKKEG